MASIILFDESEFTRKLQSLQIGTNRSVTCIASISNRIDIDSK